MARRTELVVALALAACHGRDELPAARGAAIPRARTPIVADGEVEEPDWSQRALRGPFLAADGTPARPVSELRALHAAGHLYLALYAADEDIRATDAFELTLGGTAVRIDATGAVTPPLPGVRVALDRDGTVDDAADDDEEWVLEVDVPLAAIGLGAGSALALHAARCDTPKDGITRCGAWSGTAPLE